MGDFSFLKNAYVTIAIEQQQVRRTQYLNSQMYTQKDKNMNMTLGIAIGGSLFFLMLAIVIGIVAYLKKMKERSVFYFSMYRDFLPDSSPKKSYINLEKVLHIFTSSIHKQLLDVFCKKRCSYKFRKIHRKTPVPESLLIKL